MKTYEIRKLEEKIIFQGEVIKYLSSLTARMIADDSNRERLEAIITDEKSTPAGKRLAPILDLMLESIRLT